jgi:PTS system ascorbate-specific IIA component
MAQILIVAHAPLASALLAVARHVYPDCSQQLAAVDVPPEMRHEQAEALLLQALQELTDGLPGHAGDVLVLADVFGATPCNAALAVADGVHVRVVAGLNVPMLWRALCYGGQPLDDMVVRAVAGATQGVMQVAVPRRQNQPQPPGRHDPHQGQDQ